MLQPIENLPAGIVGVRAKGRVKAHDYADVLEPIVREATGSGRPVKLLYHLGPEFDGFTPGAALEDARVGLRQFQRCAIVSEELWVRASSRLAGALFPCQLKVFRGDTWDAALSWLTEPPPERNLRHQVLPGAQVLLIEPTGPLEARDFDLVEAAVNAWVENHNSLSGIVIRFCELFGWRNFWNLFQQLRFVRQRGHEVDRLALASDVQLAHLAAMPASLFVHAEIGHFRYDEVQAAVSWARREQEESVPAP